MIKIRDRAPLTRQTFERNLERKIGGSVGQVPVSSCMHCVVSAETDGVSPRLEEKDCGAIFHLPIFRL